MVVERVYLLLLSLAIGAKSDSSLRWEHPRYAPVISDGKCTTSAAATASLIPASSDIAFIASDRKYVRPSLELRNSITPAAAAALADSSSNGIHPQSQPRQMVIFRPPSRHTYGFVENNSKYDLPILELRNLMISSSTTTACYNHDHEIRFIHVDENPLQQETTRHPSDDDGKNQMIRMQTLLPKSKNQSKKKGAKQQNTQPPVQSLYWIECCAANKEEKTIISPSEIISTAASRAILTHATFSILESISYSDEEWNDALNYCSSDDDDAGNLNRPSCCSEILDLMEMIDMDNPNMSRDARSTLIERVSCLVERHHPELQTRFQKEFGVQSTPKCCDDDTMQPILIHHQCIPPIQHDQQRQNHEHPSYNHHLYFGHRTSIGPAGTKGAPSQTLRRTHRGLLKEYALKNRRQGGTITTKNTVSERSNTSTAMEPEIGFLMCNVAFFVDRSNDVIGPKKKWESSCIRVLDPCCGSGSLLLYAAALGAGEVVGVDSDRSVWDDVECEFERHVCAINDDGTGTGTSTGTTTTKSPLRVPTFFQGDVTDPTSTKVLCMPNSFDAIVCDPPYNIGAPILVDGIDARPRNYHYNNDDDPNGDDSGSLFNKSIETTGQEPSPDIISHILAIARTVLVSGGRLVFFLPVRGEEISMPLEQVLLARGCQSWEVYDGEDDDQDLESNDLLRLVKDTTRLQHFSPTFARWLVCMEKR